jgi:hypothetical protein
MSTATLLISKIIPEKLERKIRNFRDQYLRNYNDEILPKEIYDSSLQKKKISFCTTCMNRHYHLRQTIIRNIEDNKAYQNAEFVLVNYNSGDGLHEWAKRYLTPYIEAGDLQYFYSPHHKYFHASKAKNLAHFLSTGEIVCNLDGDNFTGKDYAFYINYLFNTHNDNTIYQFKKAPYWGTEGRIVLTRKNFDALGGYDESFHPTGHQDHDLMDRAKLMGLEYKNITIENFLHYLSNSTAEKSKGLSDEKVNYYTLRDLNRVKSQENLNAMRLVANTDVDWRKIEVYKNFSNEPYVWP